MNKRVLNIFPEHYYYHKYPEPPFLYISHIFQMNNYDVYLIDLNITLNNKTEIVDYIDIVKPDIITIYIQDILIIKHNKLKSLLKILYNKRIEFVFIGEYTKSTFDLLDILWLNKYTYFNIYSDDLIHFFKVREDFLSINFDNTLFPPSLYKHSKICGVDYTGIKLFIEKDIFDRPDLLINLIRDIKLKYNLFGFKIINHPDNTEYDNIIRFIRLLIKSNLDIVYSVNVNLNIINPHLLRLLEQSNCKRLYITFNNTNEITKTNINLLNKTNIKELFWNIVINSNYNKINTYIKRNIKTGKIRFFFYIKNNDNDGFYQKIYLNKLDNLKILLKKTSFQTIKSLFIRKLYAWFYHEKS